MNWKEYYINIARNVALKSKDPSTKVGCVLVSENNEPISFGYNGFIAGCNEEYMTFERPQKALLMVHAEMNALIFAKTSLKNATAYTTHASCENCLKHLVQAGVKNIFYEQPNTNANFLTQERIEVISRIIKATGINYQNINGTNFLDEKSIPKYSVD